MKLKFIEHFDEKVIYLDTLHVHYVQSEGYLYNEYYSVLPEREIVKVKPLNDKNGTE